ncbi:MAG: hypothetical protein IJ676_05685 [Clostridia bacterium]|nr:hypothetical protein [Clostridia bacterium]
MKIDLTANLTDLNQSVIKIEIYYNESVLIGLYYLNKALYVDLGRLGLFRAVANGIDIAGLLDSMLADLPITFDADKGIDVLGLIQSIISDASAAEKGTTSKTATSIAEKGLEDAIAEIEASFAARYKAGEFKDITVTEQEELKQEISEALETANADYGNLMTEKEFEKEYNKIVKSVGIKPKSSRINESGADKSLAIFNLLFYNDRIELNPSSKALGALLGMDLPDFEGIGIAMNLDAGLTNLAVRVNMDGNNILSLTLPEEEGLTLSLNMSDAELFAKLNGMDTTGYGGLNGLLISGAGVNVDTLGLIGTLLDTLTVDHLQINLERRTDYYNRRDLYSYYPYVDKSGPTFYAEGTEGYDGTDGETLAVILKVIKIAVLTVQLVEFISKIVTTVATWGGGLPQLLKFITDGSLKGLIKNIITVIGNVNKGKAIFSTLSTVDNPKLYRNRYARAQILLNRTATNVLELDISIPTAEKAGLGAFVQEFCPGIKDIDILLNIIIKALPAVPFIGGVLASLVNALPIADAVKDLVLPIPVIHIGLIEGLLASKREDTSEYYGRLYGRITEEDGITPVEGAIVNYIHSDAVHTTKTDKDGYYYFIGLPMTAHIDEEANPYVFEKVKAGCGEGEDKEYTYRNVRYIHHNGYYYVKNDRGAITVAKDGYTTPAAVTEVYIEPAQTKTARQENFTMHKSTSEIYTRMNVTAHATLQRTTGNTIATETNMNQYVSEVNADKANNHIGGLAVKYNGGVAYGMTNMLSGSETFGTCQIVINEYGDLREGGYGRQHKFEATLGGYNWTGQAILVYEWNGTPYYFFANSEDNIDGYLNDIAKMAVPEAGVLIPTVNVDMYLPLAREESNYVTIVGSLCEYVLAEDGVDYYSRNPVIGEFYNLNSSTNEYTLTTDERFVAGKAYYKKSIPLPGDFEIWLAYADAGSTSWKTLGVKNYLDLTPDDFSSYVDSMTGTFSITTDQITKDKDVKLKIRSTKYQNIDMRINNGSTIVTYTDNKNRTAGTTYRYIDSTREYISATFALERREAHWSDATGTEEDPLIEGIRIRLGADVTEKSFSEMLATTGGNYNYSELPAENGRSVLVDDYTYVEVWFNSGTMNGVLNKVNNLLWGLDGIMEVNPNATFTPKDISIMSKTSASDFISEEELADYYDEAKILDEGKGNASDAYENLKKKFEKMLRGEYNEQDFTIGDKIYVSEGAYRQAQVAAEQKTGAALIHFLIMWLMYDKVGLNQWPAIDFAPFFNFFIKIANAFGADAAEYNDATIALWDLIAFMVSFPTAFQDVNFGSNVFLKIIATLISLIGNIAKQLQELMHWLAEVISGVLPFTTGYNMFSTATLNQSPLNAAQFKYEMKDDNGNLINNMNGNINSLFLGENKEKTYAKSFDIGGKKVELTQETTTIDRSIYGKISLNDGKSAGALDSIRVVVNSASYDQNAESRGPTIYKASVADRADTSHEWNYAYNEYLGGNGKYYSSKKRIAGETTYSVYSAAGNVTYGTTTHGGNDLYVRVKDTDSYVPASEMEADTSRYESTYYTAKTSEKISRVGVTHSFYDDPSAIFSIKGSDIRTMVIIEKGVKTAFDGYYYNENGARVQDSRYTGFTTNAAFMEDWIGKSNYGGYSVTDVYYTDDITGEKVVYFRFFVYDAYGDRYDMASSGNSIKDDKYTELELDLNGIDLRSVSTADYEGVSFYRYKYDGSAVAEGENIDGKTVWVNPKKIFVYDPYDLTDFAVIGGTWATRKGYSDQTVVRNYDAGTELADVLANRVFVQFTNGTSAGTNGVGIVWNFDAIKSFGKQTGKTYLEGYIGNSVYAGIEVEIVSVKLADAEGAENDVNKVRTELLQKAQQIDFDPYNETVEEFINKFYDVFMAEYESTTLDGASKPLRAKTYIYNDLVWSLDYTVSEIKNALGERIKIYDTLVDYDNATISLRYRAQARGDDTEKANTDWSALTIKLLNVKNYTIDTVWNTISGSGVIGGGVQTPDYNVIAARIRNANPNYTDAKVEQLANEYKGMIDINPLNNANPYKTLEDITSFNAILASGETVEGWKVLPGTFELIADAKTGRTLADYDSLDTSEQNYSVSYKVADNTGNIQTLKIWVHIQSAAVKGTLEKLENNVTLEPYNDELVTSGMSDIEVVLAKLALRENVTITYEASASDAPTEVVSLGEGAVMKYEAMAVLADDGEFKAEGFITIEGQEGLSYSIPVKMFNDETPYTIDLEVGKQGYSRTQMNRILTNILVDSLSRNNVYSSDRAKANAFDQLVATGDRYTQGVLSEALQAKRTANPLLGENWAKARVFDDLRAEYADKDGDRYSPIDVLRLDVTLLQQQMKFITYTVAGAKSNAFNAILGGGVVSARKLNDLLAEQSATMTEAEQKAAVWDIWYDTYARASISLKREIEARVVEKVSSVYFTAGSRDDIEYLPEKATIYFYNVNDGSGVQRAFNTKVVWVNEESVLNDLRDHVSYNGYLASAEAVFRDVVFGNQTIRGVAIQLNIIKTEGIVFNKSTSGSLTQAGYFSGNKWVYLGVDPYDVKTIDETLGYYFSQIGDSSEAIGLLTSTEQVGAQQIVSYNSKAWELATYTDEDGNEKVLWRFKFDTNGNGDYTDDGIGYDGKTYTTIQVMVQPYGYSSGNAAQWAPRWVDIDFAKARYTIGGFGGDKDINVENIVYNATIDGLGSDVTVDGNKVATVAKSTGTSYQYTMSIDPTKVDLSGELTFKVVYDRNKDVMPESARYSDLVGTIDLTVADMQNFYNRSYIDTNIVFGTLYNNRQSVTVRIYNNTIRTFSDVLAIEYYRGENAVDFSQDIVTAYGDLNAALPDTARVTAILGNARTEVVTLAVRWTHIDEYGANGLTAKGEFPKATALIGNATFGYVEDEVTLRVSAETITNVDYNAMNVKEGNLPTTLTIDPYDDTRDMAAMKARYVSVTMNSTVVNTVTGATTVATKQVSIKIDDSNINYTAYRVSGFAEVEHTVYFNVGNTVTFGTAKNPSSFEVRQGYPVKVTLLPRKIAAISLRERTVNGLGEEVIGDVTDLTGDIYQEAYLGDFDAADSPYAIFVQYASANEAIRLKNVVLDDVSQVVYTPAGGEYVITAHVNEGDLRQEFTLPVRINKALLAGIVTNGTVESDGTVGENDMLVYEYDAEGDKYFLSKLVVEPFIGFVGYGKFKVSDMISYNGKTDFSDYGLPEKVTALLERPNGLEETELFVSWDYSAVLEEMSVRGGEYDQSRTNVIVLASVYKDVDEKGAPINAQVARVSVSVKDRTIQNYEVSYDASKKPVPYPEAGEVKTTRTTYDGNRLYVKLRNADRYVLASEMSSTLSLYDSVYYRYVSLAAGDVTSDTFVSIDDIIYTTRNDIGTESTYELLIDPYSLKNAMFEPTFVANPTSMTYGEKLTDENGNENESFTYFRYVKAVCADGYEVTYKLTSDNYSMFDKTTKRATAVTNLYTGRSIAMTLTVGEDVIASGNERVAANDSYGLIVSPKEVDGNGDFVTENGENVFRNTIDVRILDMTYTDGHGLPKDRYFIDVYGIIETFDKVLSYEEKTIESAKNTIIGNDSVNYFWGGNYSGSVTNIVSHTFGEIAYDGIDAAKNRYDIVSVKSNGSGGVSVTLKPASGSTNGKKISYNGGVGRLAVTFGSKSEIQAGGTQVFYIPIVYVDRTVENITFATDGINGTTAPFYNEETGVFEFDPFVEYYNSPDGFAQEDGNYQQGFLRYGQYAATLNFVKTAIDEALNLSARTRSYDLSSQVVAEYIGLTFTDANLTIKYTGGTFDVFAIIQNSNTEASAFSRQKITYKAKFLSRIVGVNDNVPHGTVVISEEEVGSQWDGRVVYYHDFAGTKYEIYNGFTANLFREDTSDASKNLLETRTIKLPNGGTENVKCVNVEKLNKALKVYDYIGQVNVGNLIAESLFKTSIQDYYVYAQGASTPIRFTYGRFAAEQDIERKIGMRTVKTTLKLTTEEITGEVDGDAYNNGVMMKFILDPSYGINYRGTGLKFLMTIPGFSSGRNEQQTAVVTVTTKGQYIPFVLPTYEVNGTTAINCTNTSYTVSNGSGSIAVDVYGYTWLTYFKSVIEARNPGKSEYTIVDKTVYLTDTSFGSNGEASGYQTMQIVSYNTGTGVMTIESPYYFIVDNGMQMPAYVMVIAGDKKLYDEYKNALTVFGGTPVQGFDKRDKETFSAWLMDWLYNNSDDLTKQGHLVRKEAQKDEIDENDKLDKYSTITRRGVTRQLNANWSGASENKIAVYFNDTAREGTFKMTIDDQSVKVPFKVVPWLAGGSENAVTLFRSNNAYGPEDIIMFPLVSINKTIGDVVVKEFYNGASYERLRVYDTISNLQPKFVSDSGNGNIYGYRMYYTIGGVNYYVDITDIYGGGTFRNNNNRWYFGNVQFGIGLTQYATMTLGGKGGQTIRWEFPNLSRRTQVNDNVPTVVAISKTQGYTLPANYIARYGSGALDVTPDNIYIPIKYSEPVCTTTSSTSKKAENKVYYTTNGTYKQRMEGSGISYTRGAEETTIGATVLRTSVYLDRYTVKTNSDVSTTAVVQGLTYAMEQEDEKDVYAINEEQVAKIEWNIGGRCAYPSSLDGRGGTIYVSIYGSQAPFFFDKARASDYSSWKDYLKTWYNGKENRPIKSAYNLVRPDAEADGEYDTFIYPNTDANTIPSAYVYSGMDKSTRKKLSSTNGAYSNENSIVTIRIKKGTKFDMRYLPLLAIEYDWSAESVTVNPWRSHEDGPWYDPQMWLFSIWAGIFGNRDTMTGSQVTSVIIPWQDAEVTTLSGQRVEDGFAGIDTSSTQNRYYITSTFNIGGDTIKVKVQIQIKN